MEYRIISHSDSSEVSKRVSEYLASGWELYGELQITAYFASYGNETEHITIFAQAVVKASDVE